MVSANSLGLQRTLAVEGMGIVGLSERYARPLVEQGLLQHILPEWQLPTMTVRCATPGRRLLPARTRAFIDLFPEVMQNGPGMYGGQTTDPPVERKSVVEGTKVIV